ncbi:MAG: diguanylate cyclase [Bacteroidia bacterium]|nr:MAG: diguanylate cyclase [Bacteroidia bacterium]
MNLTTKYLGLNLRNPLVIGSSGLTDNVEKIKKLENCGAGAIVLKSLFEEQININIEKTLSESGETHPDARDYIEGYTKDKTIEEYIGLIKSAKKEVNIPIIASINCITDSDWANFASEIESAGADALELNIALLPSDVDTDSKKYEEMYFKIIQKVHKNCRLPLSVKISFYSSGLANLIYKLSASGMIEGITLFNRFYNPDINLETLELDSANVLSHPEEYTLPLRWTALLAGKVKANIAATTGIHSGKTAAKLILAGADTVHIVSAIYKHGFEYIHTVLEELESICKKHGFNSIEQMRGKASFLHNKKYNTTFERIQFMKYFGGLEI